MRLWIAYRSRRFQDLAETVRALAERAEVRFDQARGGSRRLITDTRGLRGPIEPGFALVQPPLLGVDARSLRDRAERRHAALIVITREPLTRTGLWPVVAATTSKTVRTRVAPPRTLERVETSITKDRGDVLPNERWFLDASRALGRQAVESVDDDLHPWWRVDDLVELCDVHRDDPSLLEALAGASEEAMSADEPPAPRPRNFGDPHCF
jgi:hypothetical protein